MSTQINTNTESSKDVDTDINEDLDSHRKGDLSIVLSDKYIGESGVRKYTLPSSVVIRSAADMETETSNSFYLTHQGLSKEVGGTKWR